MRRIPTAAGLATTALASSLSSRGLRAASYVGTATRSREVPDKVSLAVAQNALMDDILLPRVAKAAAAASSQVRYAPSWLGGGISDWPRGTAWMPLRTISAMKAEV